MKKASSILGSCCLLLLLLCVTAQAQQQQRSKRYTLEFPEDQPFAWTENGQFFGVAINVVTKLFDTAKIAYKLQSTPLARGMADARSTEAVCVFPVQRAQSNEAEYQWISPIYITTSGLFVAPGATEQFLVLSDAKKLVVGAVRGSGDAEYLKSFGFNVEEVSTQEQNVEKLLRKRIPVWATDVLSAQYFTQKTNSKERMPREALTFRRSLASLACHAKMPAADVAALQAALDAMIRDGSLQKMTSEVN